MYKIFYSRQGRWSSLRRGHGHGIKET